VSDLFTQSAIIAIFAGGIRLSVPLLVASLGETFGQRSGVLNLGVEGIMLLGAFGGYYVDLKTGNPWLGLLVGVGVGLVMGLVSAIMSVTFKADQGISGIGVFLFGLGLSDLLFQKWVGTPRGIDKFPELDIPGLSNIPWLGEMLFQHSIVIYLAFAAVPLSIYIINRTTFGMNIRAVGENPEAADSLGVSVARIRYTTVTIGGTLAGIAGALLAIDLGIFQQNITNARGFIAVALVYFGAWRPLGVMLGSLLYGFVGALVLQLKVLEIVPNQWSDIASMTPAVITILALVVVASRFRPPGALTKPFTRGA
jgi:simple sugar transport system permease protein